MAAQASQSGDTVLTVHRFVPHVSTVPANHGQTVGLYVRERVREDVARDAEAGKAAPRVVLFVHGGYSPSPVAYDLEYKDFSWMAHLARAGFDVFALTHTGYGASPRPYMDDPCNVDSTQQHLLIPRVLKAPAPPRYPFKMVSSRTEWDEIETAVEYFMRLRGVDKIDMIGWSTGAPRVGGYAALHPDKVRRIVFLAPSTFFDRDAPPAEFPEPGAPTILQTRERLEGERWLADAKCDGQIDDAGVRDEMWRQLMVEEGIGATWAPGGIMRAPSRMNYGWRENAAKIRAPTLIMNGEFDKFERRLDTWNALTVPDKAFIKVRCGSHFLQYERNRTVVHRASREWLECGTVEGRFFGLVEADAEGRIDRRDDVGLAP